MNYTFILNNLQPDFTTEIEIIPRHFFRKANEDEIENIKSSLVELGGRTFSFTGSQIYESDFIQKESKVGSGYFEHLPPEKWRYYVIGFEGSNSKIHVLEYASNLMKNHLDYGITFLNISPPPSRNGNNVAKQPPNNLSIS